MSVLLLEKIGSLKLIVLSKEVKDYLLNVLGISATGKIRAAVKLGTGRGALARGAQDKPGSASGAEGGVGLIKKTFALYIDYYKTR